jgi:hypothetical protein
MTRKQRVERAKERAYAFLLKNPDASARQVQLASGLTWPTARKLIAARQTPLEVIRVSPSAGETLLTNALETFKQRGKEYGSASGTVDTIATMWTAISGHLITPHTAALMLVGLKIARLKQSPGHADSIVDIAGYAAVLADVVAEGESTQ